MSVNGWFSDIDRCDVLRVADRFTVPGAKTALSVLAGALKPWSESLARCVAPETGPAKTFIVKEPHVELAQSDQELPRPSETLKRRQFLGGVRFQPQFRKNY